MINCFFINYQKPVMRFQKQLHINWRVLGIITFCNFYRPGQLVSNPYILKPELIHFP